MSGTPSNLFERNGVYWARFQIGGRDVRRSLRTSNLKEARARLKEMSGRAEELRGDPLRSRADHTWEEACERWMQLQFDELKPATQRRYETSLRMMHEHFAGRPIAQIGGPEVMAYAAARIRDGVTPATVRRDLAVASRIFKVARRAGWVTANPVPDEKAELTEKRDSIRPVPLRHIAAVIRRAPPGLADLLRFAAKSGCRQEEAGGLERRDVDFARGEVTFRTTKTNSPRVIPMTPSMRRLLARALAGKGPPEQPVFRSRKGDRLHHLSSRWRNAVQTTTSVPHFRMHDLRHTYAIRWLQRGGSIYALARRLGHTTVRTTEIYSGWLTKAPD